MKKLMLGLLAGAVFFCGGAANAKDCNGSPECGDYKLRLTVNGQPFFGSWAIVNEKPYIGIESFADYLGIERAHNYKGWSIAKSASSNTSPLELKVLAENKPVDTIRFGGVTMVSLYEAADALGLAVHKNFQRKIIQVGTGYSGEDMPGRWYRYLSRVKGWRSIDWLDPITTGKGFDFEPEHGRKSYRKL